MFCTTNMIFEIVFLTIVRIASGNSQAISNLRQLAGSYAGHDDYDEADTFLKYSSKKEPLGVRGLRNVMSDEDRVPTNPPVMNSETGRIAHSEMPFEGLNDILKESQDDYLSKNGLTNEIEAQFIITYNLRPLDIGHERSKKLIATDEMLERITIIQQKIVQVRFRMIMNLLKRASKVTTEIEYKFPEKHSCSVQLYNALLRQDWPQQYPYGLLNLVRAVKEALLKSKVENIPIAVVDEEVFKRLEFVLNRLGDRLKDHGKIVYRAFEDLVINEKRDVRMFCDIPRRAPALDLSLLLAEDSLE